MERARKPKQVTAVISEALHFNLRVASLHARKPVNALIVEGCAVIVEHYNVLHTTERVTGLAPQAEQQLEGAAKPKKVTATLPDDLYLKLVAARHYSGRPLKVLVADACRHIADHYIQRWRAEREAAGQSP